MSADKLIVALDTTDLAQAAAWAPPPTIRLAP